MAGGYLWEERAGSDLEIVDKAERRLMPQVSPFVFETIHASMA